MTISQLGYKKYDDDEAFYATNQADYSGDALDVHPAISGWHVASRETILRAIRRPDAVVAKVSMMGPHQAQVRGYVTLAKFLAGHSPREFEGILGFKAGALAGGCRVYALDISEVTIDNIGPRYLTSWSAGISPRDLDHLSDAAGGKVGYHREYPPASNPIPQFVLVRPVPALNSRALAYDQRFTP